MHSEFLEGTYVRERVCPLCQCVSLSDHGCDSVYMYVCFGHGMFLTQSHSSCDYLEILLYPRSKTSKETGAQVGLLGWATALEGRILKRHSPSNATHSVQMARSPACFSSTPLHFDVTP